MLDCQGMQATFATPVRILVDAALSLSAHYLESDSGADFYALRHKWWCGPAGVVSVRPEARESLQPLHWLA